MSIGTNVAGLASMWPDVPPEERPVFRIRITDDRMTLRVVDVTPQDDGTVMVRGDELFGSLTAPDLLEQTSSGGTPSVTRARILQPSAPLEILDLDDPNQPPLDAEVAEQTEAVVVDLDDRREAPAGAYDGPYPDHHRPEDQIQVSSAAAAAAVGHPSAQPPDDWFVLTVPKGDWASTSPLKLPRPVLDKLNATVDRRMVGRQLLIAYLIERGLDEMERGGFII